MYCCYCKNCKISRKIKKQFYVIAAQKGNMVFILIKFIGLNGKLGVIKSVDKWEFALSVKKSRITTDPSTNRNITHLLVVRDIFPYCQ